MEFKLNNDLWRHNEVWQINRNHWLEIFRGGFWSHFFFQGGLCPPDFFSAYSTDQNEPLWRKKSAPLKKKKRPSEEKKAPPWKVSPLINLPLLLKNVTGTQCGKSCFRNQNSIFGSVVPLAMFFLVCYSFVSHDILDYIDIETWKFELKFGDAWNNIITFCRVSLSNLLTRASCKCCQSGSIFSDCFPFEATPMFIVHHSSLTGQSSL